MWGRTVGTSIAAQLDTYPIGISRVSSVIVFSESLCSMRFRVWNDGCLMVFAKLGYVNPALILSMEGVASYDMLVRAVVSVFV